MSTQPDEPLELIDPDDWAWKFITSYTGEDGLKHLGNITHAHRAAGVSYDVYYLRRQKDTMFRKLMEEADRAILGAVLEVTLQDAIDGTERPVFQRGEIVGRVREIDNRLRQWLLERLDPETFHLPTRVEMVSGDAPGAFTFQLGEGDEPLELEAGSDED